MDVPAYAEPNEHVPDLDEDYLFNHEVTSGHSGRASSSIAGL